MVIAILGRLPALGIAECERVFGAQAVDWFSDQTARIAVDTLDVEGFGGIVKAGRVVAEFPHGDWYDVSKKLIHSYETAWHGHKQKITLGISAYGFQRLTGRDVQKTGLMLKSHLRHAPGSLRLVPNDTEALSSATSHHNKLGLSDNKVELLIVRDPSSGRVVIAESLGAQNITALAARDQGRPKRDAFVGMLPPKLALQMVNLAGGAHPSALLQNEFKASASPSKAHTQVRSELTLESAATRVTMNGAAPAFAKISDFSKEGANSSAGPVSSDLRAGFAETKPNDGSGDKITLLDPFCGTGVLLQEAMLRRYRAYGTDLSEKMIRYTRDNLNWLQDKYSLHGDWLLHEGDAMTTTWQQPIDAVACETYLGQPFSAPPSPAKLREVRGNCNHIISEFLKNIGTQLKPGTPLCLAVPAWRDTAGHFTHLPLITKLNALGYQPIVLKNTTPNQLLYYRENQVVARELLLLTKK
ncbi:MAG TPA: hypothetical protein VFQ70_00385 [Candidatus Saccharimonadaceae bacterium]|nr:hypothetical protein [Candidatus Saccharimonadaceae bacterium]